MENRESSSASSGRQLGDHFAQRDSEAQKDQMMHSIKLTYLIGEAAPNLPTLRVFSTISCGCISHTLLLANEKPPPLFPPFKIL